MVSTSPNSAPVVSVVAGPTSHSTTLVLGGEFDLACAGRLSTALDEQLHDGRRHIRVDAARVRFFDATVLGVLVEAHTRLLARGGTLVLTGVPARVQRLLEITGLDRVLFRAEPSPRPGRRIRSARTSPPRSSGRLRLLRLALPRS